MSLAPKVFNIHIECENGHTQDIKARGFYKEDVESWASIMDGTSPMYVYSPREDPASQIAHCNYNLPGSDNHICRALVKPCVITEVAENVVENVAEDKK